MNAEPNATDPTQSLLGADPLAEDPARRAGTGSSPRSSSKVPKSGRGKVRGFTIFIVVMLGLAVMLLVNFKTVEVEGISMFPTLKSGRRVLTSRALWLVGAVKRDDIIVLAEKDRPGYFIKRVKGLPGDEIEWAYAPRDHPMSAGKFRVPPNTYYVIGDNLDHSQDSRVFGPVEQSRLLGKVIVAR